MLVVMANDGKHEPQRLERAANRLTCYRMLLHDLPLGWCQITPLLENFVRHGHFSQIMQITAATKRNNRLLLHAEESAEVHGIAGQAFAVTLGVGIARLNT